MFCVEPVVSPIFDLVGGDWNHGILNDFPERVGNGIIIPTDKLHDFSEGYTTNQIYFHL